MDVVFYSWQTDCENRTNRTLIGDALERAARAIRNDDSIQVQPVIDRDTQGIPGAPDIRETIFRKIDAAAAFVGDVTIINSAGREQNERPTPNPNVLIELGYALKALGDSRVLLVMNTAYGRIEDLPFDLRMRRVISYSSLPEDAGRAEARSGLVGQLELALRTLLVEATATMVETPAITAFAALSEGRVDKARRLRSYMPYLTAEVQKLAPDPREPNYDDAAYDAVVASAPLVAEFAGIASEVAIDGSNELVRILFKGFEPLATLCDVDLGKVNVYASDWYDYYRFLSHELFTAFVSFLIREEQWNSIASLLNQDLFVPNAGQGRPHGATVSFAYLGRGTSIFQVRVERLQKNVFGHAELLKDRHTQGGVLHDGIPLDQFVDADYFLYLRSVLRPDDTDWTSIWTPHSVFFLGYRIPRYLIEARRMDFCTQLALALGVPSVEELRKRFAERREMVREIFPRAAMLHPASEFRPAEFGSR